MTLAICSQTPLYITQGPALKQAERYYPDIMEVQIAFCTDS